MLARTGFPQPVRTLDLAGEWCLVLDANDLGLAAGPSSWSFNDTIELPNTLTLAGKGEALAKEPQQKASMANLHQRFYDGEKPMVRGTHDRGAELNRVLALPRDLDIHD